MADCIRKFYIGSSAQRHGVIMVTLCGVLAHLYERGQKLGHTHFKVLKHFENRSPQPRSRSKGLQIRS